MRSALVLAVTVIAAAFLPLPPATVERWYSRGIYPVLQQALTRASSTVPFALLDVAAIVAFVAWLAFVVRRWRTQRGTAGLRAAVVSLITAASALYLVFLALWGLNYRRIPLEAKLAYDPTRVTREATFRLGEIAVERLNLLEPAKPDGGLASQAALESAFAEVQQRLGATRTARVAAPKRSMLSWYFRRAGIDGMTDPFFLEIILNPDMLPVEQPFALAHEWAHLAGYANESDANFLAWLTCVRADAGLQYSGWLGAYRYVVAALPRADRMSLESRLATGVRRDLVLISMRLRRADPVVSRLARNVYDSYLRANRVGEGIASYDAVLRLMVGTTFENGWVPRLRE